MFSLVPPRFRSMVATLLLSLAVSGQAVAGTSETELLLQTAQKALTAGRWEDAARLLAQAEKLPANTDLQGRIALFRRGLFTVVRLEEIRREGSLGAMGFDPIRSNEDYRQVFRGYGLDPENVTEAMKQCGRASPIRSHLLAALDSWAILSSVNRENRRRLFDFTNAIDDCELRRAVRDLKTADKARMIGLANEADVQVLTVPTLLLLAAMLNGLGERATAIALLRRGHKAYPDDLQIALNLAVLCSLQEEVPLREEAARLFRTVILQRPQVAGLHSLLALTLTSIDRPLEAEVEARKAIWLLPNSSNGHYSLAKALHAASKEAAAESCCQTALRFAPDDTDTLELLGEVLGAQRKWADAEATVRHAMTLKRNDAELHAMLGQILDEQKENYIIADYHMREAGRLAPQLKRVNAALVIFLVKHGRYGEMEAPLREILRQDKELASAHGFLGESLTFQGKIAEGEQECREAVRLDPNDPQIRYLLGINLLAQQKYPETEAICREVLRRDQSDSDVWLLLILALMAQEQCHAEAAGDVGGGIGLYVASLGQKKLHEAETAIREGLKYLPKEAKMYTMLGMILGVEQRYAEAKAALGEAYRLNPNDPETRNNFATFQSNPAGKKAP